MWDCTKQNAEKVSSLSGEKMMVVQSVTESGTPNHEWNRTWWHRQLSGGRTTNQHANPRLPIRRRNLCPEILSGSETGVSPDLVLVGLFLVRFKWSKEGKRQNGRTFRSPFPRPLLTSTNSPQTAILHGDIQTASMHAPGQRSGRRANPYKLKRNERCLASN